MIQAIVVRSGGRDEHGDSVAGTEHSIQLIAVEPVRGSEDTNRGEVGVVAFRAFVPAGSDLRHTDQVRLPAPWSGLFDVSGEPGPWDSPFTGRQFGLEVALTRHG